MNDPAGPYRTHARTLTAAAIVLVAGQAVAQPIVEGSQFTCNVMEQDTRLAFMEEPDGGEFHSIAVIQYIDEAFVEWTVYLDKEDEQRVLMHCPSGRELIIRTTAGDAERVNDRFFEMVHGDRPYTMAQIADALEELGAEARLTRNTQGDCGCRIMFGDG